MRTPARWCSPSGGIPTGPMAWPSGLGLDLGWRGNDGDVVERVCDVSGAPGVEGHPHPGGARAGRRGGAQHVRETSGQPLQFLVKRIGKVVVIQIPNEVDEALLLGA